MSLSEKAREIIEKDFVQIAGSASATLSVEELPALLQLQLKRPPTESEIQSLLKKLGGGAVSLSAWLQWLGPPCPADAESAVAADEAGPDWGAMFSHKGDYESSKDKFGPPPDFSSPENGWYWYGQDGVTGPELVAPGEDKLGVADRSADVFYIHPTSYWDGPWNMPLDDTTCRHSTDFYMATEASVFNGSCRLFVPKFRQSVIAGMGYPDEGKLATDTAYTDVKAAFKYYLSNENNGRPFLLASHSQGSLYSMRLMLDFIEGKPLFSQFVACYGIAAWAPLSLFEGPTAVFKQIKVSRSPTDLGCYISWTCEHPDTVKQHCESKRSEEVGEEWYPAMGHKVRENEWRRANGEPFVCTDPLTWVSNGLANPDAKPEEWLGMLNVFNGATKVKDSAEPQDMDTIVGQMYVPEAGLVLTKLARMMPDDFNSRFEDGSTKFISSVNQETGDLQVVPLPVELAGSQTESYEHMNFLLFWFNMRKNVADRVEVAVKK